MTETRDILRAGVVGAGVFGGYHASKYAADPRAEFIGVFDPVSDHARAVCAREGGIAFTSLTALIEEADVLTVASPASFHHDAARRALLAGKPVLVEKPLAATLGEARELVELAEKRGLVLQTGHQERFVAHAIGLFGDLPPLQRLEARRMGPASARNLDVSVTLDLMIHDIDLAIALAGAAPERVRAALLADRGGLPDHVVAELDFPGGMVAKLESSRVAATRDRVTRLDYAGGARAEIDFVAKTFANPDALPIDAGFAEREAARDSLGANVAAFLDAVSGDAPRGPAASGRDGLLALQAALDIDAAAGARSRV